MPTKLAGLPSKSVHPLHPGSMGIFFLMDGDFSEGAVKFLRVFSNFSWVLDSPSMGVTVSVVNFHVRISIIPPSMVVRDFPIMLQMGKIECRWGPHLCSTFPIRYWLPHPRVSILCILPPSIMDQEGRGNHKKPWMINGFL